jgi:hypothetical protein
MGGALPQAPILENSVRQISVRGLHVDETPIGGHFYNVETQEISRLAQQLGNLLRMRLISIET